MKDRAFNKGYRWRDEFQLNNYHARKRMAIDPHLHLRHRELLREQQ